MSMVSGIHWGSWNTSPADKGANYRVLPSTPSILIPGRLSESFRRAAWREKEPRRKATHVFLSL